MAREFATCVEYGLSLSKRIYYGKEMTPAATAAMTRSMSAMSSDVDESYFPTAVMAYAVVPEPDMVDNPDVPSYQPYVHGRCEPPALIPLHMHGVAAMEIDCCLDHANVCFSGAWRVHCIKANSKCDVRFAVPMGEQKDLVCWLSLYHQLSLYQQNCCISRILDPGFSDLKTGRPVQLCVPNGRPVHLFNTPPQAGSRGLIEPSLDNS